MTKRINITLCILLALAAYIAILFVLAFTTEAASTKSRHLIAITAAVFIGLFLWLITRDKPGKFIGQLVKTALLTGGTGFLIGFVGPLIFYPEANQGPLIGIFITGPISFLGGLITGGLYWQVAYLRSKS